MKSFLIHLSNMAEFCRCVWRISHFALQKKIKIGHYNGTFWPDSLIPTVHIGMLTSTILDHGLWLAIGKNHTVC